MAGYNVGDLTVTLSAQVNEFNRRMQAAAQSFQGVTQSAQQAQQSVSSFEKATRSAAVAAGAFVATGVFMAKQSFGVAASASELEVAMGAIEKSMGLAGGSINDAALAVRNKGIEMAEAQRIAITFAQSQLDLAQASDVARAAQDLAVISQSNSTETAMRLTYAIQTGNSRMLRSVGIQKYASEAYEEFAATIGKTVEQLTQIERQQAITNMVLEEAAKVAGVYDAAMTEPGKVLRSFPRLLNDMQLAFGNVLLDGFGPVIKASYDFTKQISLAVREGGAFAPILNNMQVAFTNLLTPLTVFINKMVTSLKAINESGFSLSNLSGEFERLAPMVAAAGAALSLFAGSNLLKMIPGLGSLANIIGARGPIALGLGVLVGTSPELRDAFLKLAEAAEPLAVAAARLTETLGTALIGSLEILVTLSTALAVAIAPVVGALASFAEFATRNEAVVHLLAAAIAALIIQSKLAAVGITSLGTATAAFGAKASLGFTAARIAAMSFFASLGPLVAITAAVYAIGKAFEYFNNRGRDMRERTEELVPVLQDLTQAFIQGEEAASGFASGMDVVMGALTAEGSEETEKFKDALLDLGVEADDLGKQMLALEDNFDVVAQQMLKNAGLSRDQAADMLRVVNATDKNGDSLISYAHHLRSIGGITSDFNDEHLRMLVALEEVQDQTENLDGPTTAAEGLLELRRSGQLSLEAFERFNQEIIDGAPAFDVYTRAVDEVKAAVDELTAAEAERAAALERAQFLEAEMAERLRHVAREHISLTSLGYASSRMYRDMARAVNGVLDEFASLEEGEADLVDITDDFIDTVNQQVKIMEAAAVGADRIATTQQIMAANFYATAVAAGATEDELLQLRRTLIILDKIDPRIDIQLGLTAESIAEQLGNARAALKRFNDMLAQGRGFSLASYEAARDLVEMLEVYASVVGQADMAGKDFRTGVNHTENDLDKLNKELKDTNVEVKTLADRFAELTAVLLGPAFAENDAVVFLEEMRDAALELAQAMGELSEAQALQQFNDQVEASIGQIQNLVTSGAGADAVNEFINGLVGPNGALAVFAQTAGIAEEDFAQSFAAIAAAQQAALNQIRFDEFVQAQGFTPEEIEAYGQFLAGLVPEDTGPVLTDITGAATGGGTTTVNINMPQGVTGEQVVEAMTDYAQTQGATIPAAYSFLNN